jgi:hypothetical protein
MGLGCSGPRELSSPFVRGEVVTCALKGAGSQQVQVPPRQGSSRPGSYPSGGGGNEAVGAWETVAAKGRLQVGRPQQA